MSELIDILGPILMHLGRLNETGVGLGTARRSDQPGSPTCRAAAALCSRVRYGSQRAPRATVCRSARHDVVKRQSERSGTEEHAGTFLAHGSSRSLRGGHCSHDAIT